MPKTWQECFYTTLYIEVVGWSDETMTSTLSPSPSLASVTIVLASIAIVAGGSKDSEALLIAHSNAILAVNPSDGSNAADPVHIDNVVRVASDSKGGFVAAAWNGSDSVLVAINSLRRNFTTMTIIPNSRVDSLALNLSDGSAIFSSGAVISCVAIGDSYSKSESKVELRGRAVAIAYDHCNSRLFYVTEGGDIEKPPVIKIVDSGNKIVASIGNLTSVRAITVDPWSGLVYWIDKIGRREFKLERADQDGNRRQTVCRRVTDQNPFDLSVGREYISWSDWHNTVVWKINKSSGTCEPEVLRRFSLARPMGVDFTQRPHSCSDREETTEQRSYRTPIPQSSATRSGTGPEEHQENNHLTTKSIPFECANFCLNAGNCSLDDITGGPVCACAPGHSGLRCELDGFYFWAFVIASSVASLAVASVLCLGITHFRSLRRRQPPVVISKRRPSAVRSFTGGAAMQKSTKGMFGAKSCGRDGAVVDLEDCCHMTLCETPCVEATFRKTSNRRNRRTNPSGTNCITIGLPGKLILRLLFWKSYSLENIL